MSTRFRRRSLKLSRVIGKKNRVTRPDVRRLSPLFLVAAAAMAIFLHVGPALADVVNSSLAKGSFEGQSVFSRPALGSVPLARPVAAFSLVYSGTLTEAGASAGNAAGDKIDLLLTAANTGNVSLHGAVLQNDVVTLVLTDGDTNGDRVLDVGETWQFRAGYRLTQADLDSDLPQDTLSFHANLAFDQLAPRSEIASVALNRVPALEIAPRLVQLSSPLPFEFVADVEVDAINHGNVTLTDLVLRADFAASSADVESAGIVSVTGFGTRQNPAFDSDGNAGLVAPGAILAPGTSGSVRLVVRARTNSVDGNVTLSVSATSPRLGDLAGGVAGSLLLPLEDSDGDGAPDTIESASADRDGDGIADATDYDPTGYFYCESDGRILKGGRIAVERAGSQDKVAGVGQQGPINILRDGSDGAYQFHVTEGGHYRLSYQLPESGRPSSRMAHTGSGDGGSALWVLGAGEVADSGFISDRSAEANPYRLEFDLEPGKPVVFNNNIPSVLCGAPALETEIAVTDGPIVLRSGRTRLAYRITAENTGSEALVGLRLDNNLAEVFEAGGFDIETVLLEEAPPRFGAEANPFFDGVSDTGLLTSGGVLRPGERVALIEVVAFRARGGQYVNNVVASGVSAVDLKPVDENSAAAEIVVAGNTGPAELVAGIDMASRSLAAGQEMRVALSITNPQSVIRKDVDIVSRLPSGISYVAGSGQIEGAGVEPTYSGDEILWSGRSVPAGGTVIVEAAFTADEDAGGSDAVLQLIARETGTGRILSSPARATLTVAGLEESCVEAAGTVFHDANQDGLRQPHEEGIAGVRVLFGDGTGVVSDRTGRYAVPCGYFDALGAANEVSVRVDPASLPAESGSIIAPQSAAVSVGSKRLPDFAVRPTADIALRLDERNFMPGSATLTRETLAQISQLLREFPGGDAKARITYAARVDDELAEQRLDLAAQLMVEAWNFTHSGSGLSVETEMARSQ
jgi:hypothetical protein